MSAVSGNLNPSSIAPVRADILSKPGKAEGKITGKVSYGHVYIQDTEKSFNYITLNSLNKFPRFKGAVKSLLTRHFKPINIQTSTGDTKTILVRTSTVAKFLGVNKKEIQKKSGKEITNMISEKQQEITHAKQSVIDPKNHGLKLASQKNFLDLKRKLLLSDESLGLGKLEKGTYVPKDAEAEAILEEKLQEYENQYQDLSPESFVNNLDHFNNAISPHVESWKEEAAKSPSSSTVKVIEYKYKEGKTINVEVLITPNGRLFAQIPNSEFAKGGFKRVSLGVDLQTGNLMAYQNLATKGDKNLVANEQKVMERVKERNGIAPVRATAYTEDSSGTGSYRIVQDLYISGSLLDQTSTMSPEVSTDPTSKAKHMKDQEARAIPKMFKAAQGLHNFHVQTGCTHRDIKIDNFLMSGEQVFLTDFDRMKEVSDTDDVRAFLVPGTNEYAPPVTLNQTAIKNEMSMSEEARQHYGQATDVYSFGLIMFAALLGKDKTGREQFIVNYSQATMAYDTSPQHLKDKRQRELEEIHAKIPEDTPYQKLAKRALHPDPDQRPTMKEMVQELAKLEAEQHMPEINNQQRRSSFFSRMSLRG